MTEKVVKEKLEGLGKRMIKEIEKNEGPTFETVLRTKSNTIFDESEGCLRTGDKTETRKFLSVAQAKTFMQTVAVAAKTKKFISEDLHASIRSLFYQLKFTLGEDIDEDMFAEQSESNALIEDLEVALGIKREDLHLTTERKGTVAGPIIIKDKFGGEVNTIDGTAMGRSGWGIPSDVDNDIEFKTTADYVLVVEKDAMWQRLNEDKFWKKENCLVITPKGQASRGTRRLLRKLADKKLPIYCFMDCDAWGWYIYWTIKTGSMNLAYLGHDFAVPEARFLGVSMKDIREFEFLQKLTITAKEVDVKRAEEMLEYPWISRHADWVAELKEVLKTKKKIEQDALQGERLTFVGEYIKDKIAKKKWMS
ncbi:DNA topoisomerase IV subunit A [Candidatus Micrarchaeota archaeon]|nr:DNA topoisomerase IV subunit A [Candidatus Micrarchaeota archaeon]